MKKSIFRMLALLLTFIMLVSGMSSALASAVQELGNIDDVEQLLFEAVLDVFPSSTLEQQFIYAQYYEEKGNADAVDALLYTLTSEQLIEFTNFKAEHGCTCFDETGSPVCEGAEICECLCHKVEAFEAHMDDLLNKLDTLESMGMDTVYQYIILLRYEEIVRAMMREGLIPSEAVNESYDTYTPPFSDEADEDTSEIALLSVAVDDGDSEEIVDEQNDVSQEALDTFNKQAADPDTRVNTNSPMGVAVSNVLKQNVATSQAFNDAYGNTSNYSDVVTSGNEESMLGQVLNLLTVDPIALASDISVDAVITPINSTADDSNIKYTLYNFGNGDGVKNFAFRSAVKNGGFQVEEYIKDKGEDKDSEFIFSKSGLGGYVGVSPTIDTITRNLNGKAFPQINNVDLSQIFTEENKVMSTYGAGLFMETADGYIEYDSYKNAASYKNGKFQLYDGIIYPYYYQQDAEGYGKGNFLPFNDLSKSGTVAQVRIAEYGYDTSGNYIGTSPKRYYLKGEVDLWFAMVIEFDFYMPENGKINGQDMVFDFTGDDDVLVYIDDVLMLDISGMHGPLTGKINFATGDVSYSSQAAKDVQKTIGTMIEEAGVQKETVHFSDVNETYETYTKHNLKFFYMERAGGRSICQLKFNMPTLPPGGLSVEKELSEDSLVTETSNVTYSFILKEKNGTVVSNKAYDLYEDGRNVTGEHSTDQSGVFTLKANQRAHFTSLDSDKTYIITENNHQYTEEGKTQWNVVDKNDVVGKVTIGSSAEVYVAPKETSGSKVTFTNTLKTTSLMVDKNVVNPRPADADNVYTFKASVKYGVDGQTPLTTIADNKGNTYAADANGEFTFTMTATAEPITFVNLPIGATVTITEVDTVNSVVINEFKTEVQATNVKNAENSIVNAEKAEVTNHSFTGVIGTDAEGNVADSTITFTNTPMIYDLTIRKTGLQTGEGGTESLEPYSSTMYRVACEGTGVDMIVAIYGNNSITIKDLPVGTYTVTELTDWSWRYSSSSDKSGQVQLDGTDDNITFINVRSEIYWLDSDCYAENTFDGSSAADRKPAVNE